MTYRFLPKTNHSRRLAFAAAVAWCLLVCPSWSADAPSWQAGTGREKITPTEPIWMTGYGNRDHPADGTAQDLWTKALASRSL